ncbi:hypothetical protein HPP92_011593 [Vanilla planifolia]|uniref:Uncharacterized protein n=1 Tax=Vanilla planifolia TaxID=51239 RepID=A0A835R363_VANPL|nr:hypothetical protein HPP92_011593 [Vanilla planifolia]
MQALDLTAKIRGWKKNSNAVASMMCYLCSFHFPDSVPGTINLKYFTEKSIGLVYFFGNTSAGPIQIATALVHHAEHLD